MSDEFDALLGLPPSTVERGQILIGDCRDTLRTLPSKSVHMVVTSPPYFGLRNYNHDQQIGLEPTPEEFITALVDVFREVHRVLRDDGTFWLNLGDSYARTGGTDKKITSNTGNQLTAQKRGDRNQRAPVGLRDKQLLGIPWRVALALQADGWVLRQDIIWHKPNPMPESVRDRCTKAHEYVFMFSKKPKYYFDSEAMKEPVAQSTKARLAQPNLANQAGSDRVPGKTNGAMKAVGDGEMRNRRSVWSVASKPFKEAHFATYPPDLIKPCIVAGTSDRGVCSYCGAPWQRIVERKAMVIERSDRTHELGRSRSSGTMVEPASSKTIGWEPTCTCDAPTVPAVVLDPFFGAGTTGLVAQNHGRRWIGCELNEEEYVGIAQRRLSMGHNGGPPLDDFDALLVD